MIYHIYWGTSGNSGLYLDEIYQCLIKASYKQKVFVSYYYPFDYGERIFFRRSDMAHCKLKGIRRKVLQFYEIIIAFIKIIISARRDKPQAINYSLISGSYRFVVIFLRVLIKVSKAKLVITCHDVCPWEDPSRESSEEMRNRQLIFNLADFLLVHNDSSITDLKNVFHIDEGKIVKHLFPIMDLTKLQRIEIIEKQCDFLFIGHLRKDKGIDFLIDTWLRSSVLNKKAVLWICGRPQGQHFDIEHLQKHNVICKLGYISENDYCRYIQSARYVVLPYLKGTNSGIISTVLSLGSNVITSDIPMFRDNPLVKGEDMFKSGDYHSLAMMLQMKMESKENNDLREALQEYKTTFNNEVTCVYKTIMCR